MKIGKFLILIAAAAAGTGVYKLTLAPRSDPEDPTSSGVYSSLTGSGSLMETYKTARSSSGDGGLVVNTPGGGGGIGSVGNPHGRSVMRSGSTLGGGREVGGGILAGGGIGSSKSSRPVSTDDVPLLQAAAKGDKEEVAKRLAKRAKADSRDANGRSALMFASWSGHNDICARLVAAGADITLEDNNGHNALDYAAGRGLIGTINELLKYAHAKDDRRYIEYATLMLAAYNNDPKQLPAGKEKLVSINRINPDGQAPLYIAAGNGSLPMMEALIERGARATLINQDGRTPLHWAAWNNKPESIELLLSKGANVSQTDRTENTALMTAAQNNSVDAVRVLLKHGADKYTANQQGKTASMIAEDNGFGELAALLK